MMKEELSCGAFCRSDFDLQFAEVYSALRQRRPLSKSQLRDYVKVFLGLSIPDKVICADHSSPMDYLWYCFSSDFVNHAGENNDAVVWANRGGGKTEIAAVATLLDCIFKPGCEVRILGGSSLQASRMYEYMQTFLRRGFEPFLQKDALKTRCTFINGSNVEVLTQSARSVRGQHIHKLRCDEVELFDEDVFSAAKFTTMSSKNIKAALEVISTMHKPYGLMQKVVSQAGKNNVKIFKWCIWEVIEKCKDRICSQCCLWSDCQGRAKQGVGYFRIDDCITQMRRSSRAGFESEMLCKKPNLENVVFDDFDLDKHVCELNYNPALPLYRTLDFGFINPFVCLWIQVDDDGVIRVIDEYQASRLTIDAHASEIKRRTRSLCGDSAVVATFCDPAGVGVNDVTGTSAVRELRSLGVAVKYRKSKILEGIELIRRALKAGDSTSRILISNKCEKLIEAMRCYHYQDCSGGFKSELPLKDGLYDHHIDAFRYFFVNYGRNNNVICRVY